MSDPTYRYGRARPPEPVDPTRRMESSWTSQPYHGQEPAPRFPPPPPQPPRVSAGRLWAGGIGTAVVVALVIVVGILLVRGVLKIPVLSAEGAGVYGSASTTTYALSGGVLALLATALLHVLLLAMPRPLQFFYWISALITAVAVLLPFTIMAQLEPQIATAGINLIAGICLTTILGSIGAAAQNLPRSGGYYG